MSKNKSKDRQAKDDPVLKRAKQEEKRELNASAVLILIAVLIIAVSLAIVYIRLSRYESFSDYVESTLLSGSRKNIDENGNYSFTHVPGFVTVGDSAEYALGILGEPDYAENEFLYFGYSYIIVENGKVIGYHKDSPDFPLTLGSAMTAGAKGEVELEDSAVTVVKKIGSPDSYFKRRWIYGDLVIMFDENYHVTRFYYE